MAYIRDILGEVIQWSKEERFVDLNLIIVGDHVDEAMFEPLWRDRGLIAKYTSCK